MIDWTDTSLRYRHWRMCFERLLQAFTRWQLGILFDIAAQPIFEYGWIDSYSINWNRIEMLFKIKEQSNTTHHRFWWDNSKERPWLELLVHKDNESGCIWFHNLSQRWWCHPFHYIQWAPVKQYRFKICLSFIFKHYIFIKINLASRIRKSSNNSTLVRKENLPLLKHHQPNAACLDLRTLIFLYCPCK